VRRLFAFFWFVCAVMAGTPTLMAVAAPTDLFPLEDRRPLAWASDEPYFVVIERRCRTVTVYRKGLWQKTYRGAVFGRAEGVKVYEGDRRTPNGLYRIQSRRVHDRWSRFLLLDYPNATDSLANQTARASGATREGPGGAIGIHGSDEPTLNRARVDWTLGCISLLDSDVEDLYQRVPLGTPVWIRP
jgi:murein L,D-transpeptidase YafK